jgi:hypothetical protein
MCKGGFANDHRPGIMIETVIGQEYMRNATGIALNGYIRG